MMIRRLVSLLVLAASAGVTVPGGWLQSARAENDDLVVGQILKVDPIAKRMVIQDRAGKTHSVVIGDHSAIVIDKGTRIPLSRVQPGATVKVRDSIFASSLTVDDELIGTIRTIDGNRIVLTQENGKDTTVDIGPETKLGAKPTANVDLSKGLIAGSRVIVVRNGSTVARSVTVEHEPASILHEFWDNFRHNLFKPLLLFFYMGFLVPILRVKSGFPYVMYQALTIFLLIAIGWHGGEELASLGPGELRSALGFMVVGFVLNFFIGVLAYLALGVMTRMRRVDKATVAGYYGSDSAGTFVTCLGVLASAGILYQAYMPVMLAVMEIPGCLVALYLVSRLRHHDMDAHGNMPDEPGYDPGARPLVAVAVAGHGNNEGHSEAVQSEEEMALERMEHEYGNGKGGKGGFLSPQLLHEVFLNPGLFLLFGGIAIGCISSLQGPEVTRADDNFFVALFQGCSACSCSRWE